LCDGKGVVFPAVWGVTLNDAGGSEWVTVYTWPRCRRLLWFQSTRPCGARLKHRRNRYDRAIVSIHAPVRGATTYV